ncbi:MAG: phage tail length tape measure family protein [Sphingomonas sp.]
MDLASLIIEVETSDVKTGVAELDKLTASGARADASIKELGTDSVRTGAQVKSASVAAAEMARAAQLSASGLDQTAGASKLAGFQLQNLTYQLNDVVVGLASGQAPMTVFLQQGSQIGQIMGSAGVGVFGLVKQVGALVGGFLIANPALLVAIGLAGTAAAAFGFMASEINKNAAVQVTWADVALGAYDVVRDYLSNTLTKAFEYFGTSTESVWKFVVETARTATNLLIGITTLAPRVIITAFQVLPAALGDIFVSGTNLAVNAINGLVTRAVASINSFATLANPILEKVGLSIPTLLAPKIPALANSYAGAAAAAGKAFVGNLTDTVNRDFIKEGATLFGNAATKRALAREAAAAGKDAGDALGKSAKAGAAKAIKEIAQDLSSAIRDLQGAFGANRGNAGLDDRLAGLQREAQLIGLVGAERDRLRVTLENQAEVEKVLAAIATARLAGDTLTIDALQRRLVLLAQINEQELKNVAAKSAAGGESDPVRQAEALSIALDNTADRAANAAQIMRDAFGEVGGAIGGLVANLADYQAAQADVVAQVKKGTITQEQATRRLGTIERKLLDDQLRGVKSLLKEQSTGYKLVQAAEQGLAAFRAVEAAKSVVQTAKSVAAGAAKMFEVLGPFGFAAVAAMIAAMAALGFSGGTTTAAPPTSPGDLQGAVGTGTVLGDKTAQSESIANALETIANNTDTDLEYSNDMVRYLRDINAGIGALTSQISRQIGLGGNGQFSTDSLGIGSSGNGGFLGLFASSKTTTLYDQGLKVFNQTVGDVLAGSFQAQVYNVTQTVKKNSGFLGIGSSTKTTYATTNGAVNGDILTQFGLIIADVTKSVGAFANSLGITVEGGIDNYLNNVSLPAISLSFKDLKGDEIQAALEAYFSSIADVLTGVLDAPLGLSSLQKAGEGLYETLARVTRTILTVNTSLSSIGLAGVGGGVGGAATAVGLSDRFGGLDAFQEAVAKFSADFLTEAERIQPVMNAVTAELARLGVSGITTNDQFKALVLGLDLSTDAGQQMFEALLAVAPAFAKVNEYLAKTGVIAKDTAKTAEELARIAQQRRGLEIALLEATGNAEAAVAARRADSIAALDESNRALQEQIYAAQDATAAQRLLADATAEAARIAQTTAEETARQAQAIADERFSLEGRILQAQGDTAALRERELAAIDPANRGLLQFIFGLEDSAIAANLAAEATTAAANAAQEAAAAAAQIADERTSLETRLLGALGDTAALRARELAALDPSNRALLDRIFAIDDERTASEAAAESAALLADEVERAADVLAQQAQAIADEIGGLQRQLLEAQGNVAALRALDLAGLLSDDARAVQNQIYAIADAAAAQQVLNAAQDEAVRVMEAAAQEQVRIANEAAQALAQIASERFGIETRLLQLQGDSAALRARELAALDPSNRALQEQIYAIEDATAATTAATAAAAESATAAAAAQAELARQQQEAAQAAETLRKAGVDLQVRYFETVGNSAAATALRRQEELAATDATLRGTLLSIYAAEDAKAAADRYTEALQQQAQAVDTARGKLSSAYDREASALKGTIDQFSNFGRSLKEFRDGLFAASGGSAASYRQLQVDFLKTSALAATGDTGALGGLQASGTAFLDASRAQASTLLEYQRDVALVARSVDTAIGAADAAVDYAQLQLDALTTLVSRYVDLNETTIGVRDAIAELQRASVTIAAPATFEPIVTSQNSQTEAITTGNDKLDARIATLETTMAGLLAAINDKLNNIDRRENKYDRGPYKAVAVEQSVAVPVA